MRWLARCANRCNERTSLGALGCVLIQDLPLLGDDRSARVRLVEEELGGLGCFIACVFALLLNLQLYIACRGALRRAGLSGEPCTGCEHPAHVQGMPHS